MWLKLKIFFITLSIFCLYNILYSVQSINQDSLYQTFKNSNTDYFKKKAAFSQISSDSLLLEIAKNSRQDFYKYNSILKIKDQEYLFKKIDNLKIDTYLFKLIFSKIDEDSILCNYLEALAHNKKFNIYNNKFIFKYLYNNIKNKKKFIRNYKFTNFVIKKNINPIKLLLNYNMKDIITVLKGDYSDDFKEAVSYIAILNHIDKFYKMDLSIYNKKTIKIINRLKKKLSLKELDKNYSKKNKNELIKITNDGNISLKDRLNAIFFIDDNLALKQIFSNEICNNEKIKRLIILKINDKNILLELYKFIKHQKNYDELFLKLLFKTDKEFLKSFIYKHMNKMQELSNGTIEILFNGIDNNDFNLKCFNRAKKEKNTKFAERLLKTGLIIEDKYILKKLEENSQQNPDSINSYSSFSHYLFKIRSQETYKKIISGNFTYRIKKEVIKYISDITYLNNLFKSSDISVKIRKEIIRHPLFQSDSLLLNIALNPRNNIEIVEQIQKKLNSSEIRRIMNKRYDNPEVRKKIITNTTDIDTILYYLNNDKDRDVRLYALNKINNDSLLFTIYKNYSKIYKKMELRNKDSEIYSIIINSIKSMKSEKLLYNIALNEKVLEFEKYTVLNNNLKDDYLLKNVFYKSKLKNKILIINKIKNKLVIKNIVNSKENKYFLDRAWCNLKRHKEWATEVKNEEYIFLSYKKHPKKKIRKQLLLGLTYNKNLLIEIDTFENDNELKELIKKYIRNYERIIEKVKINVTKNEHLSSYYRKYLVSNEVILKWIYNNSKNESNRKFVIENINDKEFILNNVKKK